MCHRVLAAVESDPRVGPSVLAGVSPEHLAAIRTAGRLSWVPAVALISLHKSYAQHAGEGAFVDLWRRQTIESVDTPLFGPLFQSAIRLFGVNPGALVRLLGQTWGVSTRGVGEVRFVLEGQGGQVRMDSLLPPCRERVVGLCMHGVIRAIYDLTDHRGEIVADDSSLETSGIFDLRLTWQRRG